MVTSHGWRLELLHWKHAMSCFPLCNKIFDVTRTRSLYKTRKLAVRGRGSRKAVSKKIDVNSSIKINNVNFMCQRFDRGYEVQDIY